MKSTGFPIFIARSRRRSRPGKEPLTDCASRFLLYVEWRGDACPGSWPQGVRLFRAPLPSLALALKVPCSARSISVGDLQNARLKLFIPGTMIFTPSSIFLREGSFLGSFQGDGATC